MAKQAGLEQLLVEELQDLFDAEKQLVRALPKMAKSATDEELESALREHLEVTRGQVQRIEEIFGSMDMRPRSRPCRGMQGIVAEGQEHLEEERGETILDAAIAGSARRVEHYEIAAYESARTLAQQLGMRDAAQLLQETLQEEMHADRLLAQISKRLAKEGVAQARFAESETAPRRNARAAGNSRAGGARQSGGRRAAGRTASASGSRSRRSGGGAAHPPPRRYRDDPPGFPRLLGRGFAAADLLGPVVRKIRPAGPRSDGAGHDGGRRKEQFQQAGQPRKRRTEAKDPRRAIEADSAQARAFHNPLGYAVPRIDPRGAEW